MMIHLIAFTVKFTLIFTLRIELDLDISETRFEFSSSSLHSPKKGNQSKTVCIKLQHFTAKRNL